MIIKTFLLTVLGIAFIAICGIGYLSGFEPHGGGAYVRFCCIMAGIIDLIVMAIILLL